MSKFISYDRACELTRAAVKHGCLRPTCREYARWSRLYPYLPSNPAVTWSDRWISFEDFFDTDNKWLYDIDGLKRMVKQALMNKELKETWKSYTKWRKDKLHCHSKPWQMKGYTTQTDFFGKYCKQKPYCFAKLSFLVRYDVENNGLKPNWRAYWKWHLENPRSHATPREMDGYTTQSNFFGVCCGKQKRRKVSV
jgi:hypothetical protein